MAYRVSGGGVEDPPPKRLASSSPSGTIPRPAARTPPMPPSVPPDELLEELELLPP
jgi:hypothetical protein